MCCLPRKSPFCPIPTCRCHITVRDSCNPNPDGHVPTLCILPPAPPPPLPELSNHMLLPSQPCQPLLRTPPLHFPPSSLPPLYNNGICIGRWCQLVWKRNHESSIGTLCLQLFLAVKQAGSLHPLPARHTPRAPPLDPSLHTKGMRPAAVIPCTPVLVLRSFDNFTRFARTNDIDHIINCKINWKICSRQVLSNASDPILECTHAVAVCHILSHSVTHAVTCSVTPCYKPSPTACRFVCSNT